MLYEADWMRIRLPVGASIKAITLENWTNTFMHHPGHYIINGEYELITSNKPVFVKVNRDMLINPCLAKPSNNGYLSPGVVDILPGWEWLESREHPVPEYRFEIIAWGCKHKIHLLPDAILKQPNIVKSMCRIALKPTKEQRKGIREQNKLTKTGKRR